MLSHHYTGARIFFSRFFRVSYSYDRRQAAETVPAHLTETITNALKEAVKRIAGTLKPLGLTVKYVLELPTVGRHDLISAGVQLHLGTPSRPVLHLQKPTIRIYWNARKETASVFNSNFVWPVKEPENVPEQHLHETVLKMADALCEDVKRLLGRDSEPESGTWSVVQVGTDHSYATEVDTFSSKEKAETEARNQGNCYVVKGTQMWNEPLGQVEEHDRPANYKFFK
jgi:hypothetical protein